MSKPDRRQGRIGAGPVGYYLSSTLRLDACMILTSQILQFVGLVPPSTSNWDPQAVQIGSLSWSISPSRMFMNRDDKAGDFCNFVL